jgi:heme A synthase
MTEEKTSNIYMLHRGLAVLLDVAVVAAFIAIGGAEHESEPLFGDYVLIALPFLVAFFGVQLVMGKDQRNIKYAAIAGAIAVPLAIVIRVSLPGYEFKPAFLIVSFIFLNLGWIAWRLLLNKLRPAK